MSQFCIMRVDKVKTNISGNARLRHNRRETPCITATNPNGKRIAIVSDENRQYKNKTFTEIFKDKTGEQKIRSNAVRALEFVLTFSPSATEEIDLKKWAEANMQWLKENFGGAKNIIDVQLHTDEKTPHIHAMVVPLDEKGKLNARAFLGGTRNRMIELQDSYARAMAPFYLERGQSRSITKRKHKDYKTFIAEQARKEEQLQFYEKLIEANMDKISYDEMEKFIEQKYREEAAAEQTQDRTIEYTTER